MEYEYSYARKVRINKQGYDDSGTYWGAAYWPLYEVTVPYRAWLDEPYRTRCGPWQDHVVRVRAASRWDAFGMVANEMSRSVVCVAQIAPLYAPYR